MKRQEVNVKIQPFIVGSGSAAAAMQKSIFSVGILEPRWQILPANKVARNEKLTVSAETDTVSLLCLANPHGLHTATLLRAAEAGFRYVLCEKPVCVSLEEVEVLKKFPKEITVGVCHGYRMMWGPQELKGLLDSGEMGRIISVEGRYWQSSAAQKAISGTPPSSNWKNDSALSGQFDVLTDLGSHWTDLMNFLAGEGPEKTMLWQSYLNSEASHRDTHVILTLDYRKLGRTLGSVSKTVHGKGNHLEINIIGEKLSASWQFSNPDTIVIGRGDETKTKSRQRSESIGSGQSPFHGMGWLEGYIETAHQLLRHADGDKTASFPTLSEAVQVMETLLKIEKR